MKRSTWLIVVVLGLVSAAAWAQQTQRGWRPLVSEAQTRSYESSRYAPAVRIGDLLIGSGVIGVTREGDNSPQAQYRRAFQRLEAVLSEHGLDLGDVAEITTYHVNLGELGNDFIAVKDEFIPEPPYPAWTAIGVDRLFLDSAMIEIRFTAAFTE